jgi:hypothetical protein
MNWVIIITVILLVVIWPLVLEIIGDILDT